MQPGKSRMHLMLATVLAGCGDSGREPFQAESLGFVEVVAQEPIQGRYRLVHAAVPAVADWIRYGIEMAIAGFGDVHGYAVQLGSPVGTMRSPGGGEVSAPEVISDLQLVGFISTLCSGITDAA